jgi:PAS domain S-box-containing protein
MGKPLRLLQVEDSESDAALIVRLLERSGYDVDSQRAEDAGQMRAALAGRAWDVIIADYRLPQFDARAALDVLHESGKDIPFIVVSATIGEDVAVEMMRSGAQDYLIKGKLARLAPAVEREIREARTRRERKRAEEALQESEARFRQLANAMPQIVWTAAPDGKLDYYNERCSRLIGHNQTVAGNDSWEPVLHPDDRQLWRDTWRQCVRQGTPCEIICRLYDRHKDTYRWFLSRAVPVRDEHGRIMRWYGTCTDIDEHKRTADALRRANQDLEQFAYSVSHDLREPLRMIAIYSEMLQRRHADALPPQAHDSLAYLTGAAQRMDALVRALRAYTSTAELRPVEVPYTDATAAAREAIANLHALIGEHRAEIDLGMLPTVPMHHHHLVQVFQNLLANGVTYHRPETPPRIWISAIEHSGAWEFVVRDDGIGIAPEYHDRIFGIFKRLHTAQQFPGTGMGLAICKKIVDMYAGMMKVTSAPGAGSTFHIIFPKQQTADTVSQRTA